MLSLKQHTKGLRLKLKKASKKVSKSVKNIFKAPFVMCIGSAEDHEPKRESAAVKKLPPPPPPPQHSTPSFSSISTQTEFPFVCEKIRQPHQPAHLDSCIKKALLNPSDGFSSTAEAAINTAQVVTTYSSDLKAFTSDPCAKNDNAQEVDTDKKLVKSLTCSALDKATVTLSHSTSLPQISSSLTTCSNGTVLHPATLVPTITFLLGSQPLHRGRNISVSVDANNINLADSVILSLHSASNSDENSSSRHDATTQTKRKVFTHFTNKLFSRKKEGWYSYSSSYRSCQ